MALWAVTKNANKKGVFVDGGGVEAANQYRCWYKGQSSTNQWRSESFLPRDSATSFLIG